MKLTISVIIILLSTGMAEAIQPVNYKAVVVKDCAFARSQEMLIQILLLRGDPEALGKYTSRFQFGKDYGLLKKDEELLLPASVVWGY